MKLRGKIPPWRAALLVLLVAVGAYATYKLTTNIPDLNVLVAFLISGLIAAAVGVMPVSPVLSGCPRTPVIFGMEEPLMSASKIPTE